jgi:hypothetical protein
MHLHGQKNCAYVVSGMRAEAYVVAQGLFPILLLPTQVICQAPYPVAAAAASSSLSQLHLTPSTYSLSPGFTVFVVDFGFPRDLFGSAIHGHRLLVVLPGPFRVAFCHLQYTTSKSFKFTLKMDL